MKYTKNQWDREIGWGNVPLEYSYPEYSYENNIWNSWNTTYKSINVKVTYNMKEVNNEL
jgi:hypothetical protein